MQDLTYYQRAARQCTGDPQLGDADYERSARALQRRIVDSVDQGDWTDCPWSESYTSWFVEQLGGCRQVVDVGAGLGFYSCLALRHLPDGGRVTAIEPDPVRASLLRELFAGEDRAMVLESAAGDRPGCSTLIKPRGCSATAADVDGTRFAVPRVVLDQHFAGTDLDLIKIDVEGAEADVLNGMREILGRGTVRLLLEYHPWIERVRPGGVALLRQCFSDAGYRLYRTDRGAVVETSRPGGRMIGLPPGLDPPVFSKGGRRG